jgi:hypothetical protein
MLKSIDLQIAAEDFRCLLNRGYPRKASMELVGNRYQLVSEERHLLHRGVFSRRDSISRHKKKIPILHARGQDLAIDGHNVIITIEVGLSGRPLVLADDGFIRDIAGLSGNYKRSEKTEEALRLIFDALKKVTPHQTLFFFDAPISMSGKLAQKVRSLLKRENLTGDAMAIKVPENILIGFPGVIATSDTAIIDRSKKVTDLAGHILNQRSTPISIIRWRRRSIRTRTLPRRFLGNSRNQHSAM